MKYSWLLFDADGTLFDFERAAALALAESFAQFGHAYAPKYLPIYNEINLREWRDFEAGKVSWAELPTKRFATFFAAIGIEADPARVDQSSFRRLRDFGGGARRQARPADLRRGLSPHGPSAQG